MSCMIRSVVHIKNFATRGHFPGSEREFDNSMGTGMKINGIRTGTRIATTEWEAMRIRAYSRNKSHGIADWYSSFLVLQLLVMSGVT